MEDLAVTVDFMKLKRELIFVLGKETVRFESENGETVVFFCGGMNFIIYKKKIIWFRQVGNKDMSDFFIHNFKDEEERAFVIDFITSKGRCRN